MNETNPKILERVRALYEAGTIDAEKVQGFAEKSVITEAEAEEIAGGVGDE